MQNALYCNTCHHEFTYSCEYPIAHGVMIYFTFGSCVGGCNTYYICKICTKQIPIEKYNQRPFSIEFHLLSHYNVIYDVIDSNVYNYKYTNEFIKSRFPYIFLLKREEDLYDIYKRTIHYVGSPFAKQRTMNERGQYIGMVHDIMLDEIALSNYYCVICEESYDSFPTANVLISHLIKKHDLIDEPTVKVIRHTQCGIKNNTLFCKIANNNTVCDGSIHTTIIDKLPPIRELIC